MKKFILSAVILFTITNIAMAENYSEISLPYGETEISTPTDANISQNEDEVNKEISESSYTEVSETTSSTEIKKRKKFFDYVNIAPATMGPRE